MIAMILATDMSVHFADLAKLKARLASKEFDPKNNDKNLCLDSILHSADISNPFKPFEIYEPWAKRVLDEFWNQVFLNNNHNRVIRKEKKGYLSAIYVIDIV